MAAATLVKSPVGPVVIGIGSVSPHELSFTLNIGQTDPCVIVYPVAVIKLLPNVLIQTFTLDDDH